MLGRKDKVVKQNNDGILYLFKKNKVTLLPRPRRLREAAGCRHRDQGRGANEERWSRSHVIVATGSNARPLPGVEFDEKRILSNDGALAIAVCPSSLGVIGAGVIGLEMGSVWRRLGAEVTVLEALPAFLGAVDEQVAKEAAKVFGRQGLKIEPRREIKASRSRRRAVKKCAWTTATRRAPSRRSRSTG